MPLPPLQDILAHIANGDILKPEIVSVLDFDGILDVRDEPEFERVWIKMEQDVGEAWERADISDEETLQALTDVRRESFLAVSRASGQHEIASYVSDDFELIGKTSLLGIDEARVEALWQSYRDQDIPSTIS